MFPHVPTRHDIVRETCALDRPTPAALLNRLMQEDWRRPPAHAEGQRLGKAAPAPQGAHS
jgi:hypothetical protein